MNRLLKFITLLTFILVLQANLVFAEIKYIDAEGQYILGDNTTDTLVEAKNNARKDAIRNASEKIFVWVQSVTEVKNSSVSNDYIRIISANILSIQSATYKIEPLNNDAIKVICHISASADDSDIQNEITKAKNNTLTYKEDRVLLPNSDKLQKLADTWIQKHFFDNNPIEAKKLMSLKTQKNVSDAYALETAQRIRNSLGHLQEAKFEGWTQFSNTDQLIYHMRFSTRFAKLTLEFNKSTGELEHFWVTLN